jgi:hypothetical protein
MSGRRRLLCQLVAVAGPIFIGVDPFVAPVIAQSGNTSPNQPATVQQRWWERLTFYGDLRLRYEGFFQDDNETRQRGRYRLRFGVRTPVSEGLDLNLRLASGEASDVNSTNQTLTEFFNRKPINIDQAMLTFTPPLARALTLGGGKFGYPLTRTQMVWDDDVNWEGGYEQVAWDGGGASWRLVAVQAPMSDVADGSDAFMFGQYGHAAFRIGRHGLQLSVADYAFKNPDQLAVALDERTDIRTQLTNAVRTDENGDVIGYESGFNLVDTIVQASFNTGRADYPLVAVADVVVNTRAADDEDTGLWLSSSYGRAAVVNTYAVSYTFARIERDAVVSAFNFSDMGPATNVTMNMATFSYMPRPRLNLDMIAIFTRLLEPRPGAANPTLTRIQVDARVTF